MVNFILNPAGVPKQIYGPLFNKGDDLTGRRMTKRQTAPLILDALKERDDYVEIVGNITKIAASIQSNSRCQMLHRVSRDATVGERVELWEGWHPWFRRSMASS